ncbi:formate dehydrogenase accessory sulfurtransferase FdhD [Gemmatimonas sp.]
MNDGATADTWMLAVETPVEICVNGEPFAVMLATPSSLTELALGLLITEQVVVATTAVLHSHVAVGLNEARVDLHFPSSAVQRDRLRSRAMPGSSGCGLCGIETLAQLQTRPARSGTKKRTVGDPALQRAFRDFPGVQRLNAATRSVHAAAWCSLDGDILLVREDVGRHNALDKLVGALATSRRLEEEGFIVMSSRCSYELVAKTSFTAAQLLATISAPTTMALQWARALDLPVVGTSRRGDTLAIVHFDSHGTPPSMPSIP